MQPVSVPVKPEAGIISTSAVEQSQPKPETRQPVSAAARDAMTRMLWKQPAGTAERLRSAAEQFMRKAFMEEPESAAERTDPVKRSTSKEAWWKLMPARGEPPSAEATEPATEK